ncbi:MAG TPA: hypothetical protein VE223_06110 [Nitrososphaeraceae archaeon]|nr:hypothetical protein [Nitrososphaeraceae archaeon]
MPNWRGLAQWLTGLPFGYFYRRIKAIVIDRISSLGNLFIIINFVDKHHRCFSRSIAVETI